MTKLRVAVFSVLLMLPFAALESRLFWMQVVDPEEFRSRGDMTRTWVEVVPTPRGRIFDRNGELLAAEERCFDVDFVPADFELPRQKGRDPALDYGRLARVMRDLLGLVGAGAGFDDRQCAAMLKGREFPVKSVLGADGKTVVVPDQEQIGTMLRAGGVAPRTEPAQMYLKAVRALKASDKAVQARCSIPGKPVGARDRRTMVRQEWRQPQRLWQGLTYDQISEVAIDEEQFPGLEIRSRTKRIYPAQRGACQVLGYPGQMGEDEYARLEKAGVFRREMGLELTEEEKEFRRQAEAEAARDGRTAHWPDRVNPALVGRVTPEEYDRLEFRGAFYGDWVGRSGIELQYEDLLSGKRGIERRAKNLMTKREWVVDRIDPVAGKDVTLTLDMKLQKKAEELLDTLPHGLKGSIVVLDVKTGEVLALASAPGYDANWLMPPIGKEEWELLMDAEEAPMVNRALSGHYPPGSWWKTITGSAALESGKVTPQDKFECRGYYYPEKRKFGCWIAAHNGVHGMLDMREGLARSCNCFFFETGNRTGIDAIAEMASRFGIGRKSGIDLPGEAIGQVPSPAWRRAHGGGRWGLADTLNVSIGQGELLASPMQAARVMAGLATGRLPVPRMRLDAEARFEDLNLKPSTLDEIRSGLIAVTMEDFGTGHKSGVYLFKAAGKTSTAQSSSHSRGLEHHGWFAGYAPYDDPKYAFCVMVEHGGAGSGLPADVAARLMHAIWPEVDLPGDMLAPPAPPVSNYDATPTPSEATDDEGDSTPVEGPVQDPDAAPMGAPR